jgi:hypothetical protein
MTDFRARRPAPTEHGPYYSLYIDRVPDGDVLATLAGQVATTVAALRDLPAARADFAYAPGKWTVRQVLGHIVDCERVMAYRALRFARADATPLPGFDENLFADGAPHPRVPIADLAAELELVRRANLCFLGQLDDAQWGRGGTANDQPITVRALAWVIAGHELHHRRVLAERYGV